MDLVFKNMDFPIKHWAAYPRRYPSLFPLATMNDVLEKRDWVRAAFNSCNFSLILGGRGEYRRFGTVWPVRSPCVITQWPGQHVEYGPSANEAWHELYLIYDAALFPIFQKHRLVDLATPVWPIANIPAVQAHVEELASLARCQHPEEMADRVDRVCERLVLETWLPPASISEESEEVSIIQSIVQRLRRDLAEDMDIDALAGRHGMSPATFRRRWAEVVPVPPARYRLELRLREACRLLTETTRPVHEVARIVGFQDELYFSRRFHQEMKLAPRAYRRMYQIHRG